MKALLEAGQYCADPKNALEVRQILASREYLSTDVAYIQLGDPTSASCNLDRPMREYAHHIFFGDGANRPSRTEHLWHIVQMARWGDVPFPRNWLEILERVCRVGVFSTAARELGVLDVKYNRGSIQLFDGSTFDPEDPISYLNNLKIKRDFTMAEIILDSRSIKAA